ncbi:hypothetical protein CC2G_015283 [Coprinopsis cinerea AmutBmut pab1-1]|nr:hypothetical protein CC2G_015283 [Coprinopsis cinerea AmutBmut pab1-1]
MDLSRPSPADIIPDVTCPTCLPECTRCPSMAMEHPSGSKVPLNTVAPWTCPSWHLDWIRARHIHHPRSQRQRIGSGSQLRLLVHTLTVTLLYCLVGMDDPLEGEVFCRPGKYSISLVEARKCRGSIGPGFIYCSNTPRMTSSGSELICWRSVTFSTLTEVSICAGIMAEWCTVEDDWGYCVCSGISIVFIRDPNSRQRDDWNTALTGCRFETIALYDGTTVDLSTTRKALWQRPSNNQMCSRPHVLIRRGRKLNLVIGGGLISK